MRKREPESIGEILADMGRTSPIGQLLEQALVWDRWAELAGPKLAPHGQPLGFRNNVLIVAAESPVWMHKFVFRKWALISRINRVAQRELVSDIFVIHAPDAPAAPETGFEPPPSTT